MNIQFQPTWQGKQGLSLNDIRAMSKPRISLTDRLRSSYHRFWYEATQALRWSRGSYRETPNGTGLDLTPRQHNRIGELGEIYGARFELRYPPETTLLNYGYLDMLDRARQTLNWTISQHPQVCDVGSSNFAYARPFKPFSTHHTLSALKLRGTASIVTGEAASITQMAIFRTWRTRTM